MATVTKPTLQPSGRIRMLSRTERRTLWSMLAFIAFLHVAGWTLLVLASRGHYGVGSTKVLGIGTGVLAYTLGMRHAFDADHIAAIDRCRRASGSPSATPQWSSR